MTHLNGKMVSHRGRGHGGQVGEGVRGVVQSQDVWFYEFLDLVSSQSQQTLKRLPRASFPNVLAGAKEGRFRCDWCNRLLEKIRLERSRNVTADLYSNLFNPLP